MLQISKNKEKVTSTSHSTNMASDTVAIAIRKIVIVALVVSMRIPQMG